MSPEVVSRTDSPPLAQDAPTTGRTERARSHDAAREFYSQGAAAFGAGRFLEAVRYFRLAARHEPKPELSYNIALAYDSMGQTSEALRWYREYLRQFPAAPDRVQVFESVRRLEGELRALGVQQVTIISVPEGATVRLDEEVVGITPWTGETTAGQHRLELTLSGHAPATSEFVLPEQHALDVELVLRKTPSVPRPANSLAASPARGEAKAEERNPHPTIRPLTWVVLGGGAALLGTAGLVELGRGRAEQGARDAKTQLNAERQVELMERREVMARAVAIVGAAAAVVGGTLLVLDLTDRRRPTRALVTGTGSRSGWALATWRRF